MMICSIIVFYFYKKNNYNSAMYDTYWQHTIHQRYIGTYEDFFLIYGEYPQSAEEMRDSFLSEHNDEVEYLDWISTNFFASDNRSVAYFPVYNRQRKRVSAVILSVGIDGKENN